MAEQYFTDLYFLNIYLDWQTQDEEKLSVPSKYLKSKYLMLHGSGGLGLQFVWCGMVWCGVVQD